MAFNDQNNINDLNSAINFNQDNMNKQNNSHNKMGIIFVIALVLILVIIFTVILMLHKPTVVVNNTTESFNTVTGNIITQEVSNDTIVDDDTQTINKSYAKVDIVFLNRDDQMIDLPLAPVCGDLKPVKFDSINKKFVEVDRLDPSWYNYENKMWANAINTDGSYFVWIPRFAYKITYYSDANLTKAIGYSDSRGILKINTTDGRIEHSLYRIQKNSSDIKEIGNHYMLAPAFMRDALNNYENGGWDTSLDGFWVAKYEMAMEQDQKNVNIENKSQGDVKVNDKIKAVSKPMIYSWRNISVGNAYFNGINYDTSKQSHILKNSEWAAISYLANSKYGQDGSHVYKNSDYNYITGGSTNVTQLYFTNSNESTTGNATGVYDMSGGTKEYIATFISNNCDFLSQNGGTDKDMIYENSFNSKFKTIYNSDPSDQGIVGTYSQEMAAKNFILTREKRGDAFYETANSAIGASSWENGYSYFMQTDVPFLVRGGSAMDAQGAGLYSFVANAGQAEDSNGFRVALVTER